MSIVYRTGHRSVLVESRGAELLLAAGIHAAGFPAGDGEGVADLLIAVGPNAERRFVAGAPALEGLVIDLQAGRLAYRGPAWELPDGVYRVALSELGGGGALRACTIELELALPIKPLQGGELGVSLPRLRETLAQLLGLEHANRVIGDEPVDLGMSLDLGAVAGAGGSLTVSGDGVAPLALRLTDGAGLVEDGKLLGLRRPTVWYRMLRGLSPRPRPGAPAESTTGEPEAVVSVESDVLDPGGGDVIEDHVAQAVSGLLHRTARMALECNAGNARTIDVGELRPVPFQPARPLVKLVWDAHPAAIVERKLVMLSDGKCERGGAELDMLLPASYGPASKAQRIAKVVVVRDEDPFRALDRALADSGFDEVVRARAAAVGVPLASLRVALKPNLMFMYSLNDRSTFTDPALVLALVDRLRALGCRDIALVEAESLYGQYVEGRSVRRVAEYVGYRTDDPRYRVVSLTEEMVPFDYGYRLGQHFVGPTWRDAQLRISFAKNKTHTFSYYTLCLKNTYGCLPLGNKLLEYHANRAIEYPTIDALRHFPVHFGVVNATLSADGDFGIFADRDPNRTDTVIAGDDIVAVDWVGARKQGQHPMVSEYMREATAAFGKPEIEWIGDHTPYPDFKLPLRVTPEFWNRAHKNHAFTDAVFRALHAMDAYFPRRRESWWQRLLRALGFPIRDLVFQEPRANPPAAPPADKKSGVG